MTNERTNFDRAEAAKAALASYIATNSGRYSEEPIEDQVGDLLCDLLHLVRRDGLQGELLDGEPQSDPTDLLDRARANFEEEEEGESTCSECGAALDDGEGYDGKCGSCADRAEGVGAHDPRNAR